MWKKEYLKQCGREILEKKEVKYPLFNSDRDLLLQSNQILELKNKNKPEFLYKYTSLNLPRDEEKLFNLLSGKILLTNLCDFNDIDEGDNFISDIFRSLVKSASQANNQYLGIISNFGESCREIFGVSSGKVKENGYSDSKIISRINHLLEGKLKDLWIEDAESHMPVLMGIKGDLFLILYSFFALKDVIQSYTKASCFTEISPDEDSLMWHHYADNHRGICLKYNTSMIPHHLEEKIENNFFPQFGFIHPVSYEKSIIFAGDKGKIFDEIVTKSILIKNKKWAYEKEWRIVLNSRYLESNYINYTVPSEVFLGKNLSKHFVSLMESIVKDVNDWIPSTCRKIKVIRL